MAKKTVKTFLDLQDAVMEELKLQSTDTVSRERIKRDINFIYQNEVAKKAHWPWLKGYTTLRHKMPISTGTVSVTNGSETIIFSSAPTVALKNYYITINNEDEIYVISGQFSAGSATAYLESAYVGETDATASYQMWSYRLALPQECGETVEVWHNHFSNPLDNLGLQEFRQKTLYIPDIDGFPSCYTTQGTIDPTPYSAIESLPSLSTRASSGLVKTLTFGATITSFIAAGDRIQVSRSGSQAYNGEFIVATSSGSSITYTGVENLEESATADATLQVLARNQKTSDEEVKELWLHPSIITEQDVVIHVDYQKRVEELEDDADEPLMPIEDRAVLLYGALSRQWVKHRDPDTFSANVSLFQNKIKMMASDANDSIDKPSIIVDGNYIQRKRMGSNRRRRFVRRY